MRKSSDVGITSIPTTHSGHGSQSSEIAPATPGTGTKTSPGSPDTAPLSRWTWDPSTSRAPPQPGVEEPPRISQVGRRCPPLPGGPRARGGRPQRRQDAGGSHGGSHGFLASYFGRAGTRPRRTEPPPPPFPLAAPPRPWRRLGFGEGGRPPGDPGSMGEVVRMESAKSKGRCRPLLVDLSLLPRSVRSGPTLPHWHPPNRRLGAICGGDTSTCYSE